MLGMSVKSVPGCFVAIAPILIAAPVAFLPVPRPQTLFFAVSLPDPTTAWAGDWLAPVAKAASSNAMTLLAPSAIAAVSFFDLIPPPLVRPPQWQLRAVNSRLDRSA